MEVRPECDAALEVLQLFEGTVLSIGEGEFTARLVDRTDPSASPEVATFFMSRVSVTDRALVSIGAVFDWSIGYRTRPWGQRERSQFLRFRRPAVWTRTDLEHARTQAHVWAQLFGVDEAR